jgi:two-component system cell cycle sensor histidine kinase/response regulator CckA
MTGSGAKEKLYEILDELHEGYFECDVGGCTVFANLAFCRITGFGRQEVIGKKFSGLSGNGSAGESDQIFDEVRRTGVPAGFENRDWVSKCGRTMKIRLSISPITDEAGGFAGFRGTIRDLTDLDRCTQELARMRKLEAIGIISGGIAHDYNNALTAIMGNIALAKMEAGQDNRTLLELLNEAEAASFKAVELTRRLSIFGRGGRPDRKVIDYRESLRETVHSVLEGYSGRYELNIHDGLWKVEIDEFQINRAITCLLNNAVESREEPGKIGVSAENFVVQNAASRFEISLSPGNYLRISISDEGDGIKPDDLAIIFDPFFTTKKTAGGMGLATSYAIIKRHYGYIDVKSEEGKGTTFYLYLPAVPS